MLSDKKIIEQIEEVLEELRPYFFMHGGNVTLDKYDSGKVYVRLNGNCSTCPASSFTLKLLIEDSLKAQVPQVTEVIEIS